MTNVVLTMPSSVTQTVDCTEMMTDFRIILRTPGYDDTDFIVLARGELTADSVRSLATVLKTWCDIYFGTEDAEKKDLKE
jgi:hypothetical protein